MALAMFQYAREFVELQVEFARRVSVVVDLPLEDSLRDYTMLESGELFGTRNDPGAWLSFVDGIGRRRGSLAGWAYEFYLERLKERPAPNTSARIGCFVFDYTPADRSISLHLLRDPARKGTLSRRHRGERQREIREMFRTISADYPSATLVRGRSWLYHIDAYRCLFPPAYLASAKSIGYVTKGPSLWGQFVARDGKLREPASSAFMAQVEAAKSEVALLRSFPFDVLALASPIAVFDRHFGRPGHEEL